MCVSVYLVCTYVCVLDAGLVRPRLEKGAGTAGTGIIDGFKLPWGCWRPNLGPLQEQQMLLMAKLALEFPHYIFLKHFANPPDWQWWQWVTPSKSSTVISFCSSNYLN